MSDNIAELTARIEEMQALVGKDNLHLFERLKNEQAKAISRQTAGCRACREEIAELEMQNRNHLFDLGVMTDERDALVKKVAELERDKARISSRVTELEMVIRGVPRAEIGAAMNQAAHGEVKTQSFKEGYPVYVCRQCSKRYKEHGPNEECPVGKQREVKPK